MLVSRSGSLFESHVHVVRSTGDPTACIVLATQYTKLTFGYRRERHLLAVCKHGVRNDGDISVEGLHPSRLRDMTRKLKFAPAGHSYSDWHEPRILSRMPYFHSFAIRFPASSLAPRLLLENPALFGTAICLSRSFEMSGAGSLYFDALGTVLGHDVLDLDAEHAGPRTHRTTGVTPTAFRRSLDGPPISDHTA